MGWPETLPKTAGHTALATMAIVVTALLWAGNFWVLKPTLTEIHPLVMNAVRFGLAVLCLAPFVVRRLRGVRWAPAVGLGLVGHFTFQTGFILGLADTSVGSSALIGASTPIWIAVLSIVFLKEPVTRRDMIGLTVALLGMALVTLSGQDLEMGEHALRGNLLSALAAVAWAIYTVFSRPLMRGVGALPFTFASMLGALPALIIVALPHWPQGAELGFDRPVWLAILYSGVLATALGYALWNWAVQQLGPVRVALLSYIVPIVALAGGVACFQEPVNALQLVGGTLVIGGLSWAMLRPADPATSS